MTELEQRAIASLKGDGIVPTIDAVRAWVLGYLASNKALFRGLLEQAK